MPKTCSQAAADCAYCGIKRDWSWVRRTVGHGKFCGREWCRDHQRRGKCRCSDHPGYHTADSSRVTLDWLAQLQKNGEGKNQKTARFASGEFKSGQTCVKHPREERRELVDIAAEERGLRSLQDSKFYNKSPYLGHFRYLLLEKPRPDETKNGGLATPQFFSTVGSIPKWKPPSSS
jgi:hypothetical protein